VDGFPSSKKLTIHILSGYQSQQCLIGWFLLKKYAIFLSPVGYSLILVMG
jgi:hypothetical protein